MSNGRGGRLATFLNGSEKFYNFPALRIHRSRVRDVLLEEVKAQGIEVHYEMRLASVDKETETSVSVRFTNGRTVKADFVIGTDGVHSKTRQYIHPSAESHYSGLIGITGSLQRQQLHKSSHETYLPNMFFGQTGFMAVMPSNVTGTDIGFFTTMEYPSHSKDEWDDFDKDKERLRNILTERHCDGTGTDLVSDMCEKVPGDSLNVWP